MPGAVVVGDRFNVEEDKIRNPLITKLECFTELSHDEKQLITDVTCDVREFGRREDIIREGDKPESVHLLLEGWACRYKVLPNGERPIMGFLIPGDLCDVHVALLDEMDHSIGTLSGCKIAFLPREAVSELISRNERLCRALWWANLVDEAILREWLVTLGHRPADKRLAHFFCEMLLRAKAVGLTEDDSFDLPVTQEELGDTMGLSTVHINRMMQELRGQGLVTSKGKRLIVNDLEKLMAFADSNPNYLHYSKTVNGERQAACG